MSHAPSLFEDSLRILLLAGGPSAEREVSLESGAAVAAALRERGHAVTEYDPASRTLDGVNRADFDVAFIALHGTFGEDGQVQQLLEEIELPYTGSDSVTSAVTMSKIATKQQLIAHSLPTPDFYIIHPREAAESFCRKSAALGYPLVMKPDSEGSSLGVTIVSGALELPAALANCFQYGPDGLMETCIHGQEWTVGLIDHLVLPPVQIVSSREFYDYEAKYASEETQYLFASETPPSVLESMQQIAVETCRVLGTRGIARVDFRLDRFQRPWILEVNTIPGMTSHSLIPKAAARLGISFGEVCERALQSAFASRESRVRIAA
ncbi:MAG: D-alanine--D-alanine ligase [Planctomycetaceae bacterium]|nr:D-alanine--D-alanine ligase [Planctomycetaceae bacterium]